MKAEERARQMMHLVMEVFKIYALLTMILFLVNVSVLESACARYRKREWEAAGSHHYIKYVQHASCLHGQEKKKTRDRLRELVREIAQRTPSPALTSG